MTSLENLTKEELMTLAKYAYKNMTRQQVKSILITPLATKPTPKPALKLKNAPLCLLQDLLQDLKKNTYACSNTRPENLFAHQRLQTKKDYRCL